MENIQINSEPQAANSNGARKRIMYAIVILLAVASTILAARWVEFRMKYTATDDAQVDADLLPISSKSAGRILKVYVAEGDAVKKGTLLAEIDPKDYRLTLERARAGLDISKRDLEKAEATLSLTETRTSLGIQQSESGVEQADSSLEITRTQQSVNKERLRKESERAQVNLNRVGERIDEVGALTAQAKTDSDRAQSLYKAGVISQSHLDLAQTNTNAAADRLAQVMQEKADAEKLVQLTKSNLRAASIDDSQQAIAKQNKRKAGLSLTLSRSQQEEVKAARSAVQGLRARIRDMSAAVRQAEIALHETRIVSPVDGIVARKVSQPFEVISVGKPVFFVLDTSRVWVTANIEETRLKYITDNSKAEVRVDAYPGKTFNGHVFTVGVATNSKFSLIPASNTTGQYIKVTQHVPVKILLDGDTSRLRPGMNVEVKIKNNR